jgi:hypothetical protein
MKKLLLASAIALFGLSNAQIAKGTTYLSGSVGYSQVETNNGNNKTENFNVLPTVGYFVNKLSSRFRNWVPNSKRYKYLLTVLPNTTIVTTNEVKPCFCCSSFRKKILDFR